MVIVTADHGMPGLAAASRRHFAADVVELLNARFDPEGRRLVRNYEPSNAQLYLDGERLRELAISLADVRPPPRVAPLRLRRLHRGRGPPRREAPAL